MVAGMTTPGPRNGVASSLGSSDPRQGGVVPKDRSDVVGAAEFGGVGGRHGRPAAAYAAMTTEQANYERLIAAYRTNPADPTSGEAQGDLVP